MQERRAVVSRKEEHSYGDVTRFHITQSHCFSFEEPRRQLGEYSSTVAGAAIGVHRTSVCQVAKGLKRSLDDIVTRTPRTIGDEPDATRIVFVAWIVK
jgi:hypothetical protein